ncbi:MAG: hypothetical protein Q4G51_15555 [Dermatophilus congolensis]|nr:hypothetical protein [Dermatophilus congolensis]
MLTLTAPSFGRVHRVPKPEASPRLSASAQRAWRIRAARSACRCGVRHEPGDSIAGTPLDVAAYDYQGQAAWNSGTGRLWNRTATRLTRSLGLEGRLAYAGVAEMQSRGAVHFHLLVRLPGWVTLDLYTDSSERRRSRVIEKEVAASSTRFQGREMAWGAQCIAEIIVTPGDDHRHARRTIGYIKKSLAYVTKDLLTGDGDSSDHIVDCQVAADISCPRCGTDDPENPPRHPCRSPRHRALGYSGWPLRRSRSWSTVTFTTCRAARRAWHGEQDHACSPRVWTFLNQGYDGTTDALLSHLIDAETPPPLATGEPLDAATAAVRRWCHSAGRLL